MVGDSCLMLLASGSRAAGGWQEQVVEGQDEDGGRTGAWSSVAMTSRGLRVPASFFYIEKSMVKTCVSDREKNAVCLLISHLSLHRGTVGSKGSWPLIWPPSIPIGFSNMMLHASHIVGQVKAF
jgi:hypothetical protein